MEFVAMDGLPLRLTLTLGAGSGTFVGCGNRKIPLPDSGEFAYESWAL